MHDTSARPAPAPLRLSRRLTQFAARPFTHFEIDDFVSSDFYHALDLAFPGAEQFAGGTADGKRAFNSRSESFGAFLNANPAWKMLCDAFCTPAFVTDVHALCRRATIRTRGWRGLRPWVLADRAPRGRLCRRFIQPVKVTFEFSRLPRGSWITPHTDGNSKLLSLMFYFPDEDWKAEWGGGTAYYAARNDQARRKWSNWRNDHVSCEDIDAFFADNATMRTVSFIANRLAGFVKSANSYHGVAPIECPADRERRSLNINIVAA